MADERRGRRNRPGDEYVEAEMTLPNPARRETAPMAPPPSEKLPPPPAGLPPLTSGLLATERPRTTMRGMPLPGPTTGPGAPERTAILPTQPQTGDPETAPRDTETFARQAAHAAAQLAQRTQPSEGPVVRATTVFHKASLALEASELVQVHRMPPNRKIDPRFLMLAAPDSPAAASFRVLRHRLAERKGVKVILVTSPRAGEGKTMCAVNLALALGEAGRARVLLLEVNFRSPSLARLFGFLPPICVRDQLELHRTHPAQPWVVVETVGYWLHTAAVAPDTASGPILDGPALFQCIEDFRRAGYDYIVVDSPSILGSADVNLIEEGVDGILIAMWARRSRARALRKAVEQIGRTKLLGVVLLGT